MNPASFDRLTRIVARSASRRLLGGAALGSVVALLGLGEAEAARCPKGKKKCKKKCIPRKACCTNAKCKSSATGQVCKRGRCVCPPGRPKECNGRCVPTTQCCGAECDPCNGVICDEEVENGRSVCQDGQCAITCDDGFDDCDGDRENGCEIDVLNDSQHCGMCDAPCEADHRCCAGECKDRLTDNDHCGNCNRSCESPSQCCTGTCITFATNILNCGACGNVCPGFGRANTITECRDGQCRFDCSGENYDVDGDPDNGCEVTDEHTNNHSRSSARATNPSTAGCNDAPKTFSGQILSDHHSHREFSDFDRDTGSAADWWKVRSTGGFCGTPSATATIRTSGGTSDTCYRLEVHNSGGLRQSVDVSGNNQTGVSPAPVPYMIGSEVFFVVYKTCLASVVTEVMNYTVEFEL